MTGRTDDVMVDLMTPVDGQGGEMVEVAAGRRVYLVEKWGAKGSVDGVKVKSLWHGWVETWIVMYVWACCSCCTIGSRVAGKVMEGMRK